MLYQGMMDQGIGKAELGRRLGWRLSQVDKVLDIQHQSRMDHMDAALGAIGRQLQVSTTARP
jgi:antitoxin HicB